MKRSHNNIFVDLEARVEDGEDVEGEEAEDGYDDFLEDRPVDNEYIPWTSFSEDREENSSGWGHILRSLEERYSQGTPRIAGGIKTPLETDPSMISAIDKIMNSPSPGDTPLWRVRCKLGLEEDIVFFLLQKAAPTHELRSAFMRHSIRGWVYLEATMNPRLRYLLQRTPGIVVGNSGILTQRIKFEDWLPLLEMHDTKELPKVGKWVEVLKGLYNGDVGYVDSVEPWGVQLFLVPRIPASEPSNVLPFKRKRSRPCATPTLFDPLVIKQVYGVESRRVQEHCYRFKGCDFEYGLILKQFDFSSISTAVHPMDLSLFSLFLESRHPKLLRDKCSFPRPLEWDFAQGDEVCLSSLPSDTDHGIINSLLMDSVEVDFGTKKGVVRVPWLDIHKVINPGDFVEITGGEYRGRTGWFDGTGRMPGETFRNVASVIEVMNIDKPLDDRIKVLDVHINSLKRIAVPLVLGTQQPRLQHTIRSDPVPWLNTEIIITERHARKGYRGIILDVLCNQQTSSGLRVQVQLTTFDPNAPFPRMLLDYDDVIEASHGMKLYDYMRPKSELFMPRNYKTLLLTLSTPLIGQPSLNVCNATAGYTTPMPESSFSSSPAWDPNSHLPELELEQSSPLAGPSHLPVPCANKHILLDPRLLDAQLKVTVGGPHHNKEQNVTINSSNGQLSIVHTHYKTSTALTPEWVTPRHPSATHDNGLLVVIKGEDCGKYVRRIYHRYDGEKPIMLLAVVNRLAGQADTLTEGRLELDVSYLCLCNDKDHKEENSQLMKGLRQAARKIRAK